MPLQLDGGTGKRLDSRVRRAQWAEVEDVQMSRPGPVSVPSDSMGGGSETSIGRLIRYVHGYNRARYMGTVVRTEVAVRTCLR